MLEIESKPPINGYEFDFPRRKEALYSKKSNKLKNVIGNLNISDYLSEKTKKRIVLGCELLIIAVHFAFFFLRILNM